MSIESRMRPGVVIFNTVTGSGDVFGAEDEAFDAGTATISIIWPVSTREDLINRDTKLSKWRMVIPPNAVIDAQAEVTFKTHRFRVAGDPLLYENRSGPKVILVELEEITG